MNHEFKNARHCNITDMVDCDIKHPQYGWIPHTVSKVENPELYKKVLAANPKTYVKPDFTNEEVDYHIDQRINQLWDAVDNVDRLNKQNEALYKLNHTSLSASAKSTITNKFDKIDGIKSKGDKLKALTNRKDVDPADDIHWV